MTLTDPGAVLILGAGSSAPFGMPLGGQLIDELAKAIETERRILFDGSGRQTNDASQRLFDATKYHQEFNSLPVHGTVARTVSHGSSVSADLPGAIEGLRRLRELLDGQTAETIDDFIADNAGVATYAKLGMAALMVHKSYEFGDGATRLKDFAGRHSKLPRYDSTTGKTSEISVRNWVHLLINVLRHWIRGTRPTPSHKVQIITFNYDTILEHVLAAQFRNTERAYAHYSDYVDICHVHGSFGDLEEESAGPAARAVEWASGIHVVHEEQVPTLVSEARRAARSVVQNASEIYVAGFSFAAGNCRLLGLDQISPDPIDGHRIPLKYCNYEGNVGVRESVARLSAGIEPIEAAGSIERPLNVVDWFRAGYPGELPG